MLPRQHRIKSGEDFRLIMRTGDRIAASNFTVFISRNETSNVRFGFVISKAVGSAVTRNRIKRQLRSIASSLLSKLDPRDIVIRVNPSAARSDFDSLSKDLRAALARSKS